jgi:hypothetical protein
MSILAVDSLQPAGLTSVTPSVIYILTSDTYATVTTTGYLTQSAAHGNTYNDTQMALVYTTDDGPVWLKVVITYSGATVLNTVVSLVETSSPGDVILPTVANHLIVSTNTSGTLANLTGTAINDGSIQAGLSGTAGTLISYPATASKGSLIVAAVANTGNTTTTLSNDAMGQASVVNIPDPGNAIGQLLIGATATPFVSGNFPQNSGTAGLMVDSGVAVSALAQTANVVVLAPSADQTITAHNLIVSQGNLVAGSSGHAGTLSSFPATASKGSLVLTAVANTGNTTTTISNAAMGQASVISIPDPAGATADFVLAPAALVSGNAVKASGTAGLVADAGYAFHAGTTGTYGGGGTSNAFTVSGMASTWIVTASILTQTNAASIVKAVPSTNTLTITFSADPGASTTVSWIASTASV